LRQGVTVQLAMTAAGFFRERSRSRRMPQEVTDQVEPRRELKIPGDEPTAEDETLVAEAKKGHTPAFEALVERHRRTVLGVSQRITRNREDAEDVTQQSFQQAFVHLDEFAGDSSFSTWVTRIAINEALMLLRKNRRSREVSLEDPSGGIAGAWFLDIPDSSPSPEERYWRMQQQRILLLALAQLNPKKRAAIVVQDLGARSVRETAQILGISDAAVKARRYCGRAKLREVFKQHVEWARGLRGGRLAATRRSNGTEHHRFSGDADR
jgi:RNA polymerase sigma-70 factor (ECF subfamily)